MRVCVCNYSSELLCVNSIDCVIGGEEGSILLIHCRQLDLMFISSASCRYANISLQQAEDKEEEEETCLIKREQALCFVNTLAVKSA